MVSNFFVGLTNWGVIKCYQEEVFNNINFGEEYVYYPVFFYVAGGLNDLMLSCRWNTKMLVFVTTTVIKV